uniref:zinc finger BED domain-containing protein 1-like n=1 Tax=Osmia lignaria TaxID=473952 RepID=UPI001478BCC4|nr:zinc finger BED domain-containing protein 1-like [Osmia lignaria]
MLVVYSVKTRIKKSKVWELLKKDPNDKKLSVCMIYHTEIYNSGNTSNYWNHLHRYHASKLKKSIEREEEWSPSQSTPNESEPEGIRTETENQCVNTQKNLCRKHFKYQPSLKKFIKKQRLCYGANSKQKVILDKALMKFITRDLQPLSIVNDIGFQEFVNELNPRYSLPSRPTVTNVLIPKMYEETKKKITIILNTVNVARESYLTVTGHFIFDSKLEAALLNFIHVSDE